MAPPRISPASRLAERTERVGECLIWRGSKTRDGYGVMGVGRNQQRRAHRIAYELAHGDIPAGMVVCHRCDTPLCCNPEHLFLGTPAQNTADMIAKGRQVSVRDREHPNTKISHADREAVRTRRLAGATLNELAAEYGVAFQTISSICRGAKSYAAGN